MRQNLRRKLKYQTDKLLRLAAAPNSSLGIDGMEASADQGGEDAEDPLSFRPRPEAMAPWGEGDAGVSGENLSREDHVMFFESCLLRGSKEMVWLICVPCVRPPSTKYVHVVKVFYL